MAAEPMQDLQNVADMLIATSSEIEDFIRDKERNPGTLTIIAKNITELVKELRTIQKRLKQ